MPTNEFLPFGTGVGANVLTQPEYLALADRLSGMGPGLVPSVKVNKALRQTSSMVAALAEFIMERTGEDLLDDGDTAALKALIFDSIAAVAAGTGTGGVTIDALQIQIDALLAGIVPVVTASDTTRTFQLGDAGVEVQRTASTTMTDTIPNDVDVLFDSGMTIAIRVAGTGDYSLVPAAGVTLNVPAGAVAAARAQGSTLMLHKIGFNQWDLTGDLSDGSGSAGLVSTVAWASTIDIDLRLYPNNASLLITLAGNTTINITGGRDRQKVMLELKQDGVGDRSVTLGPSFRFGSTVASYTASVVADAVDLVGLSFNEGTGLARVLAVSKGY